MISRSTERGFAARPVILGCASQGAGSGDEARLRELLRNFATTFVPFDRAQKLGSFRSCLARLRAGGFDLFVVEGTGFAAGVAAILGRILWGRCYVLSSGDAVGPFLSARHPLGAPVFHVYERALYGWSSGFIGWTPYLVGRALTMGAKRAVTAPGWAPRVSLSRRELGSEGRAIRQSLGIPEEALVFGIAGSLVWSKRYAYCYGAELVRAAAQSKSRRARVLIVGDGSGLEPLKRLAGGQLGKTIFFAGRVPREEVPQYLAAMDVGSLPQSVDGVGSFRYTTKLPEYRAAGLLIATNQIPMAYDLDRGDMLRLEGRSPWSGEFVSALARLMDSLERREVMALEAVLRDGTDFAPESQIARVTAFLTDVIETLPGRGGVRL